MTAKKSPGKSPSKASAKKAKGSAASGDGQLIIKKYANRRLYNTAASRYITLDDLSQMVREDVDFRVVDAKSDKDITRSVLTQIIVEHESQGQNLLPVSFLRHLIGLYGDNLQWMVPRYLEASMINFTANQEKLRSYFNDTFGPFSPIEQMEAVRQNNAQLVENAVNMFGMFVPTGEENPGPDSPKEPRAPEGSEESKGFGKSNTSKDVENLQDQLERLQRELEEIKNRK